MGTPFPQANEGDDGDPGSRARAPLHEVVRDARLQTRQALVVPRLRSAVSNWNPTQSVKWLP